MRLPPPIRLNRRGLRRALRAASELLGAPWAPTPFASFAARAQGVIEIDAFGSNPGQLRMLVYVPPEPPRPGAPVVMLLHGCGQDAAAFAAQSGWMAVAEQNRLPLLLPEQTAGNNRHRCFNWFRPGDTRRGRGELLSLRQMLAEAKRRFGSDPARSYVVGLSAGGAMAASLLAAYPEAFAAGAVVAGLPVGTASSISEAVLRMHHADVTVPAAEWEARLRRAAPPRFSRNWPRLSIWHGSEDRVVDPRHAEIMAAQWTAVHGLAGPPVIDARVPPEARHQVWGNPGAAAVELWTIGGIGHGFPIDAREGGTPGPFVVEAGIGATQWIARSWGLRQG
ncbi:MAG TPA: PHB depolymerase family esterase [Acetobacteraceae bacterium]|nr:PHB depolymerase family esterase [Acetobacteraceae bacterium]